MKINNNSALIVALTLAVVILAATLFIVARFKVESSNSQAALLEKHAVQEKY